MESEKIQQSLIAMYSGWENLQANESVPLYEGPLVLRDDYQSFSGSGRIEFAFVPDVAVRYNIVIENLLSLIQTPGDNLKLIVPSMGIKVDTHLTAYTMSIFSSGSKTPMKGTLDKPAQYGTEERIGRVKFSLVNFHRYHGESVQRVNGDGHKWWGGRATFEFGKWTVTLDALPDLDERRKQAEAVNGYVITHVGMLRRTDDKLFGTEEATKVLDFLYWFFSFVNGSRCGCILPVGLRHTGRNLWESWQAPKISPLQHWKSWFTKHDPKRCLEAAQGCYSLWQDESKREWLRRAIAIYVESNRNVSGVDLVLANAQTALELLSWVVLVEEKKVISEEGFLKLPASDKFRLLLGISGIPATIPASATDLLKSFGTKVDGPHAISEIRNAVIHPTRKKQEWLNSLSNITQYEAWQLSMWYIELVLLRLFGYSGPHDNRFGNPPAHIYEIVPWAKS